MSAPESTSSEPKAVQSPSSSLPKPSLATRVRSAWATDVDPASSSATWMLIYLCFLTGYTSSVTFSACFIWCVCSCSLWFDCEEGARERVGVKGSGPHLRQVKGNRLHRPLRLEQGGRRAREQRSSAQRRKVKCTDTLDRFLVRCGFQTGGVAQLGLAVARNFAPVGERTYHFEKPDQQALTSLLSFLLGTSIGRLGDRWGCKKKGWLVTSSWIQAILLMAAAVAGHYCGEPAVASCVPSFSSCSGASGLVLSC